MFSIHNRRCSAVLRVLLAIPLLLVVLLMNTGDASAQQAAEPQIRVLLIEDAPSVTFKTVGSRELVNEYTGAVIASPRSGEVFTVSWQRSQLQVARGSDVLGSFRGPLVLQETSGTLCLLGAGDTGSERAIREGIAVVGASGQVSVLPCDARQLVVANSRGTSTVNVASPGDSVFSLEQSNTFKRYRGELRLIADSAGLLAINTLSIEQYLYSVVPSEALIGWPEETYKAQAVAARSYVLFSRKPNSLYDVCQTHMTQVYHGYDQERAVTTRAVKASRGEVLVYEGKPIAAYFHSSSGGYTENIEDVWTYPVAYIRSVPDPYDANGQHYNWQVSYSADQLREQLASRNYLFSTVANVEVMAKTASGHRVKRLLVEGKGTRGEPQMMVIENADRVRVALGLKSSFFTMLKETGPAGQLQRVTFNGNGWGHGLGMSQWGAYGMAHQGHGYRDILHYYYRGVTLEANYGL